MTWVEANRDGALSERFIADLVSKPLAEIAASPYVASRWLDCSTSTKRMWKRSAAWPAWSRVWCSPIFAGTHHLGEQVHRLLPLSGGALRGHGPVAGQAHEGFGRIQSLAYSARAHDIASCVNATAAAATRP